MDLNHPQMASYTQSLLAVLRVIRSSIVDPLVTKAERAKSSKRSELLSTACAAFKQEVRLLHDATSLRKTVFLQDFPTIQ